MPDYAEVAGCSTFRNTTTSPLYDSYGAYATTNLVRNASMFTSNFPHGNQKNNSVYSAPTICHFNTNDGHNFIHSDRNFPTNRTASKMNIIENKIDVINNLNRSSSVALATGTASTASTIMATTINSVPSTPIIGVGTMRRNRLPKVGHCDKISFGGCDNGRNFDQPLFIKSKEDGSWTSVQNSAYHFTTASTTALNKCSSVSVNGIGGGGGVGDSKYKTNGSNNSNYIINNNNNDNNNKSIHNIASNVATSAASQIYLSSFGKADNV